MGGVSEVRGLLVTFGGLGHEAGRCAECAGKVADYRTAENARFGVSCCGMHSVGRFEDVFQEGRR